jgi:hypothetical protein
MKPDAAFAAVIEANPVPDPERFEQSRGTGDAFLSATKEKSKHMDTLEHTESTDTGNRGTSRRRWQPGAAIAVFLIVVAVGVALAVAFRGASEVVNIPAPPFDTPQEAAEAYAAAMAAGDYAASQALFAPDGWDRNLGNPSVAEPTRLEARFVFRSARTDSVGEIGCEPISEFGVTCTIHYEDPFLARLADDASIAIRQSFTLNEQGQLVSVSAEEILFSADQQEVNTRFNDWLLEQHPDLLEEILSIFNSDPIVRPAAEISADSLAAADEYVAESQN